MPRHLRYWVEPEKFLHEQRQRRRAIGLLVVIDFEQAAEGRLGQIATLCEKATITRIEQWRWRKCLAARCQSRETMGYSRYDPVRQHRSAWNAGKTVGTKRPLTQKQIWAIRFLLDREGRLRDKALFDLAINSKLRGCDLVKIKIGDVFAGGEIRNRATIIQQKSNRPVQFELTVRSQHLWHRFEVVN